jgi:hypothetical protein
MIMRCRSNLRSAARALAAFSLIRHKAAAPRGSRRLASYRPRLEAFEDRTVLSTLTVLNNFDSGSGSLRDTLAAASSNDTIVFDPSLNDQMITLTSGELAITKSLDIEGPGASLLAISGNDDSRVFDIGRGSVVTIAGLTISHGRADVSAPGMPSGGGGILNFGALTLANDVLSANQAVGDASASPLGYLGAAGGGGILNAGTLTVSGTTFTSNLAQGANSITTSAAPNGVGIGAGGAILSVGFAAVSDSAFDHNQALGGSQNNNSSDPMNIDSGHAVGGAIDNFGQLTVTGTRFSSNQAIGGHDNQGGSLVGLARGGGIYSGGSASTMFTVSHSTFDHNQAIGGNNCQSTTASGPFGPGVAAGGGIAVTSGTATISDSTLEQNEAMGGQGVAGGTGGLSAGGGIFISPRFSAVVSATVRDCTIIHNSAAGGSSGSGGSVGDAEGGGFASLGAGAMAPVQDTTVTENQASGGAQAPDQEQR